MVDIQTIGVAVDTTGLKKGQAELNKTTAAANKTADAADGTSKKFSALSSASAMLGRALAAVGVAGLARQYIQVADAVTLMDARLKLAVGSGADFAQAQEDIFRISQKNAVGLQETASLYTKLNDPIRALGGGTAEVAAITEAFATTLKVSGASAAEASSATLQFAQAMGSGALRGDEFNSIAEASPRLMKALAAGMQVPIGALRDMAADGKLTADVVGNALVSQLEVLRKEGESIPLTVGAAMQQLSNTALVMVGDFDKLTGGSGSLADMMSRVLGPAMKGVFSIAVGVQQAFQSLGLGIGGTLAAIAAVLRGEFGQARTILEETGRDLSKNWAAAGELINKTWSETATTSAAVTGEVKKLTAATKVDTDAKKKNKAAADALKAAEKERLELMNLSRQAQIDYVEALQRQEDAAEEALQADIKLRRELQAERDNAIVDQGIREREEAEKVRGKELTEYEKHWDRISDSMVDSLMQGGKSVAEYLKGLFRSLVLQPILKMGVQGALGAIGLGGSGSAMAGGLGSISNIASIGSAISSIPGAIASGFAEAAAGASFVGPGVGLAGGATGMAGQLGAALQAIPGWGWALAGVAALLGSGFGKTPGEQHTGGFFSSSGSGSALGVTGGNEAWARDLTNRLNPEIAGVVEATVGAVISSTQANAKALGMDIALGIDAGFAANTNGQGKNKNAFGYFTLTANGETIAEYINRELGSDVTAAFQTFTQEMADAAAIFVLGGEQFVGAGESASQTLARLAQNMMILKTPAEQFAAYQANLREQFSELNLRVPNSTDELRRWIDSIDTSSEAGRQLKTQLLELVPAFTQIANVVQQVFDSISATTAKSVRDIQMSIMSDAEKYNFLDTEIVGFLDQLKTATVPSEIERLFNLANQNVTTAYGLLGEDEQKRLNAEYVDRLYELEALAQERLSISGERETQIVEQQAQTAQTQQAAAERMMEAATAMIAAANAINAAAEKPVVVEVATVGSTNGIASNVNFA